MNATFDTLPTQQFNVFLVAQVAPDTFLDGVLGVDYVKIPANSTSEIHRHNHSDNVIYVVNGTATIMLDGNEHPIAPGMRACIPRGMFHGFRTQGQILEFVSAQIPPILDRKTSTFDREIQT